MDYLKEVARVFKQYGMKHLFRLSLEHVKRKIWSYSDLLFDIKHGVNTCGQKSIVDLIENDTIDPCYISYEPTPIRVIKKVLRSITLNDETVFVDYGSGKGRVLLLASEYKFNKIVGIEISKYLHNIAQSNITIWNSKTVKRSQIESININALDFAIPEEPLVIFFFTPFVGKVFYDIVEKIKKHIKNSMHTTQIVYYGSNSDNLDMLIELKMLHKVIDMGSSNAYDGRCQIHIFSNI